MWYVIITSCLSPVKNVIPPLSHQTTPLLPTPLRTTPLSPTWLATRLLFLFPGFGLLFLLCLVCAAFCRTDCFYLNSYMAVSSAATKLVAFGFGCSGCLGYSKERVVCQYTHSDQRRSAAYTDEGVHDYVRSLSA